MKAKKTKRVMTTMTRVASNDKGDGDVNEGDERATATRAMVVTTTVVGNNEGNGNGDEGGGQQRG